MEFNFNTYNEFQKQYDGESDRSVVILASSYLDNYLELLIKLKLADHKVANKLFEGYGPFATFSAKTDVALVLGVITEHTHTDLNIIRKIRNIFAHEVKTLSFETTQIQDRCSNLLSAKGYPKSDGTKRIIKGSKAQFLSSIFWCNLHMQAEQERIEKISIKKTHFVEVVEQDNDA